MSRRDRYKPGGTSKFRLDNRRGRTGLVIDAAPPLDERNAKGLEREPARGTYRVQDVPGSALILTPELVGLPPLTEPQRRFLEMPTRQGLMLCGLGAGKTTVGLYWAFLQAHHPRNVEMGATIAVLAPTYRMIARTHIPALKRMCEQATNRCGWRILRKFHASDFTFHFAVGTRLVMLSYEGDHTRMASYSFAAILMDEPDKELGGDAPYNYALTRLRGGGTEQIRAVTTPNGYQGVTRIFAEARADHERRASFGVVRAPTWSNPASVEMYRDASSTMSRSQARQLLEAEVDRPSDVVYSEFDSGKHVTDWWPQPGSQWWAAIDWGFSHAHIVWGVRDESDRIIVLGEWGQDETTTHATVDALERIQRDEFGGRPPLEIYPDRADMPDLDHKDRGNVILHRRFPRSRIRTPSSRDVHAVWPKVQLVKRLLEPADSAEPKLLVHQRLVRGNRYTPDGTSVVDALSTLRRRKMGGHPVDEIGPNQPRTEHAADCLHYLCWGMEGGFGSGAFGLLSAV
jgi:hypothetical protein